MKRALKYLKPYWHLVTLIFIFVALRALGDFLPLFMGKIVGEGLGLKQNSIEVVLNVKVIVKGQPIWY